MLITHLKTCNQHLLIFSRYLYSICEKEPMEEEEKKRTFHIKIAIQVIHKHIMTIRLHNVINLICE